MTTFSFSTVKEFDKHINTSIVGYSDLISDIITISDYFVEEGMRTYDLGCSTGKLLKELSVKHPKSFFVGIDKEENFSKGFKNEGNLQLLNKDLLQIKSYEDATFITSIFTMQFLSEEARRKVIQTVYDSLKAGGCFLWSEKVLSSYPKFQDMLQFMYYDKKLESFQADEILDKERSLRSMMKLLTLEENLDILRAVGFTKVEVFWKRYNFVGLIAIK
jgi:tRNA (cmo5U34)-methyltransferase